MSGGCNTSDNWAEELKELKKLPRTPENLAKCGWTAPRRGDSLAFESFEFSASALPDSLRIAKPSFVTSPLSFDDIERLARMITKITPPKLWMEVAKISNTLRVRVNNSVPFEIPIDLIETAGEKEAIPLLQVAVYKALKIVLDFVDTLEQRHEEGTAEPGPYKLAFSLEEVEKEDDSAKYVKDHGNARAEIGK